MQDEYKTSDFWYYCMHDFDIFLIREGFHEAYYKYNNNSNKIRWLTCIEIMLIMVMVIAMG